MLAQSSKKYSDICSILSMSRSSVLRRLEKLPEIDSLIAATTIRYNTNYFYTFDEDFTRLNNRKI
ncbi:MAG: PIN domain-containing protein [Thaumarchaeota archaeon]|nr:PIN domain-containing protein [Nitrososphaerota archaeon]